MFFDDVEQIPEIAARTGCSIFVTDPSNIPFKAHDSTIITPLEDKKTISIAQIRHLIKATKGKFKKDHFFVITPADAMLAPAANSLLKTIEQPLENCHFVLITKSPSLLLPTILSRSQLYFLRQPIDFYKAPKSDPKVQTLAKKLISANSSALPDLAKTIHDHKPDPRGFALQILETAIEMLYKTFCQTHHPKWLAKLPLFITAYENIHQNGHVKLHLVADLC